MVKVKISEVEHARSILHSQSASLKSELGSLSNSMTSVPQSQGFVGATQKNMTSYTQAVHANSISLLIDNLSHLDTNFNKLLNSFRVSVDTSSNAVLDDEILKRLESKLTNIASEVSDNISTANKGIGETNGYASCTHVSTKSVTKIKDANTSVKNTQKALDAFNGQSVENLKNLSDSIGKVKKILTRASGHPVKDFTTDSINKAVDFKDASAITKKYKIVKNDKIKASINGDGKKRTVSISEYISDNKALGVVNISGSGDSKDKGKNLLNEIIDYSTKTVKGFLKNIFIKKLSDATDESINILNNIYIVYRHSPILKNYSYDILKTISFLNLSKKVIKQIPVIGTGITFFDDYNKSHDVGQGAVHAGISFCVDTATETIGLAGGTVGEFLAVGANTVSNDQIDKGFEEAPTKTWRKKIDQAYDRRGELENKYIEENSNLSDDNKKILKKYENNPGDIYEKIYDK